MNEGNPLPYPRGFGRLLLRLPILLYRLGLGGLVNAGHIMLLGTRGRKSGLPRYTAIEYRTHGSKIYVVSAWGERPNWVQNLQDDPDVLVQQGKRHFGATATLVTNSGEALRVLHLFRRRAPIVYDSLIARLSDRESVDERTLPEVTQNVTIIRIDPNPGAAHLSVLPADFVWVLPALFVVSLVITLVISLTRSRQPGDA